MYSGIEKTPELISKIEQGAALGCSVEEIALFAGISRATLYNWMNADPAMLDRIKELQDRPILLARQTVLKDIEKPETAKWYLERKRAMEFGQKNLNVKIDGKLLTESLTDKQKAELINSLSIDGAETNDSAGIIDATSKGESGDVRGADGQEVHDPVVPQGNNQGFALGGEG
jgi:hypothetical protein